MATTEVHVEEESLECPLDIVSDYEGKYGCFFERLLTFLEENESELLDESQLSGKVKVKILCFDYNVNLHF